MQLNDSVYQKNSKDEKIIFGISLGSSARDHVGEFKAGGHSFRLIRKGTDGSLPEAVDIIRGLDGKVDAFGLGCGVFNIKVNGSSYSFRQMQPLKKAATRTKFADGNRVKSILNENAISSLCAEGVELEGKKTLHMGTVDRYSLAKALAQNKCDVIFGDIMFGFGLHLPVRKLKTIERISSVCLPLLTRLPQNWFNLTGMEKDKAPSHKFRKYFEEAELIVGDYNWIKKHLPDDLSGKTILTNTTTQQDVEELRIRGLKLLVTTTPRINGRSFGTNIIEAMLFSLLDKPVDQVSDTDLRALIDTIHIKPGIERLN